MTALLIQVILKSFFLPFTFPLFLGENERLHKENCNENEENNIDNDCEEDVKITTKPGESLLFVYQAKWQQRLLLKYENELSLLDATYKTTRYALPLFFLVIKTNIDYQVVATFVTESESTESIAEALQALSSGTQHTSLDIL